MSDSPGADLRAALSLALEAAGLNERTISEALGALARMAPPFIETRNPRDFVLNDTEFRSRIFARMVDRGCTREDATNAATLSLEVYRPFVVDFAALHPKATRNEIIRALWTEAHPDLNAPPSR